MPTFADKHQTQSKADTDGDSFTKVNLAINQSAEKNFDPMIVRDKKD